MYLSWTPQPTFQYDVNIAEVVATWDIPESTKYSINICRLYKQVYFLGDLLEPYATKLKPGARLLQE